MNAPAHRVDMFPPPINQAAMMIERDEPPMTVDEFCHRYGLSRSHYYVLKREGRTPDELRVGRKTHITAASARAWERRMVTERKAARAAGKPR